MGPKTARSGTQFRAYLCAFTTGDLHLLKHWRKIRVEASTTHPAQLRLISSLFGSEGQEIRYPIRTPRSFGWRQVHHLSNRFSFLLESRAKTLDALQSTRTFYAALAGIVDSEGHVGIRRAHFRPTPVVTISNADSLLVRTISSMLTRRGYIPSAEVTRLENGSRMFQIFVNGLSAVRLPRRLTLHHDEKAAAKDIVLSFPGNPERAHSKYSALRIGIRRSRDECVREAKLEYMYRNEKKLQKIAAMRSLREAARKLKSAGKTTTQIATSLGRSGRSAYRLLKSEAGGA